MSMLDELWLKVLNPTMCHNNAEEISSGRPEPSRGVRRQLPRVVGDGGYVVSSCIIGGGGDGFAIAGRDSLSGSGNLCRESHWELETNGPSNGESRRKWNR
ncbi:hypothetical protein U1Q18_036875 [Sarracenia purpurea var. burkii]